MVAADLAAVHIDCNCTLIAAGFTLSDNSSLCIPCDLSAIHVERTAAGLTNLYFDAIERTAIETELVATRYCYTTIGFTGIRFQFPFPIHTTVRQLRGAGWVNASNIGKRHGIAVQADVGVSQTDRPPCQGHISGQVVIAGSRQFIRFCPRLEGNACIVCMPIDILAAIATDAMCMDALLTQHNRIAIVTQIKLKAQAIILEPIRYKLRKIAPACRIRHGNAVAQALLPCHRNAEFRGRVKRIKVNLLICRQQNVLVIAGNLRLAAERKVAALNMHAYRIPTDFAALHAECAVRRQLNAHRAAGNRATLHHECAALKLHDGACAGDRAAGGLFVVGHQRQRAARRDRDGIAAGSQRVAVQAEHSLSCDIPCAAQRGVRVQIVIAAAAGRAVQRLKFVQLAADHVRVQRLPCVGIAAFRHAPVGGIERRCAAIGLLIQPPRLGVVRARALAVVEQPRHLTAFKRVVVSFVVMLALRSAVQARERFVQIIVLVIIQLSIEAVAVFDRPATQTGRDGVVLRTGRLVVAEFPVKIAAFDRAGFVVCIRDARRLCAAGGGKFADRAAAVFDRAGVVIGDQTEIAADGEHAVDPHGAALDRAAVLPCNHSAAGGRGHRADLDRQPLHPAGFADPPEQIRHAVFGVDRVPVAVKCADVSQVIADARPAVAQCDVRRELCAELTPTVFVHAVHELIQLVQTADEYGVLCRPLRPLGAQQRLLRTLRRCLVLRCQSRRRQERQAERERQKQAQYSLFHIFPP